MVSIIRHTRVRSLDLVDFFDAGDEHLGSSVCRWRLSHRSDGLQSARVLQHTSERNRHVPHSVEEAREEVSQYVTEST